MNTTPSPSTSHVINVQQYAVGSTLSFTLSSTLAVFALFRRLNTCDVELDGVHHADQQQGGWDERELQ